MAGGSSTITRPPPPVTLLFPAGLEVMLSSPMSPQEVPGSGASTLVRRGLPSESGVDPPPPPLPISFKNAIAFCKVLGETTTPAVVASPGGDAMVSAETPKFQELCGLWCGVNRCDDDDCCCCCCCECIALLLLLLFAKERGLLWCGSLVELVEELSIGWATAKKGEYGPPPGAIS